MSRRGYGARAVLENFVQGDLIIGRMPPLKDVETVVALLEPQAENVWEFRIRRPAKGIRIFGRFAALDVFVAANFSKVEDLLDLTGESHDARKWRNEMLRCRTEWKNLFHPYEPIHGINLHDFVSNSRLPI